MHSQPLLSEIEILTSEPQKQFADFVVSPCELQQKQVAGKRTVSEYRDKIVVHDNFDEPLEDGFFF